MDFWSPHGEFSFDDTQQPLFSIYNHIPQAVYNSKFLMNELWIWMMMQVNLVKVSSERM